MVYGLSLWGGAGEEQGVPGGVCGGAGGQGGGQGGGRYQERAGAASCHRAPAPAGNQPVVCLLLNPEEEEQELQIKQDMKQQQINNKPSKKEKLNL